MKLLLLSLVLVSSGDVIPTDDSRTTSNHVFSFVRRSVFGKRRTQSLDLRAIFVFCFEENSELRAGWAPGCLNAQRELREESQSHGRIDARPWESALGGFCFA